MNTYQKISEARRVLGIPEQATLSEIKAKYRKLIKKWHPDINQENKDQCDEMTKKRGRIRAEKGIQPVRSWCPNCQGYRNMQPPSISIRSLIFALKKINMINDAEFKKLDSEWKKYKRDNNLNAYGKIKS